MNSADRIKGKYDRLAQFYDYLLGVQCFGRARRRQFELANIEPDHRVLIAGVGTGLDIPYLPQCREIVGVDISRAMLARAERRAAGKNVSLYEMDMHNLQFASQYFDIAIVNLVLSIVVDPHQVLAEVSRTLKVPGHIWILHRGRQAGLLREMLNVLSVGALGISVTRPIDELIEDLPLYKMTEERICMIDIIELVPTT